MRTLRLLGLTLSLLAGIGAVRTLHASEFDAVTISRNIQQLHMPFGTVLDPIFASSDPESPDYSQIVGYIRAGDSAIWTGHYLAAEAFRFQVTRSPDALDAVRHTLDGIRALLDVTGTDVLARFVGPVDSPYAPAIQEHEAGHGIYYNAEQTYFWIGNTSRDQYSGIMFGLSVAYDMVDDEDVRAFIRPMVTRILNYLLANRWNIVMPDGRVSTTFVPRPDQQLAFLQIGRRIDPAGFASTYSSYRARYASSVRLPIWFDNADDHGHYFKFNLNYINLYNLVRLEESASPYRRYYVDAYRMLRSRTAQHGNAHFNMVDRALEGENGTRDAETVILLDLWLQRPRREDWVDLRDRYVACGENRACSPIPVHERVNTDFLWQRSPFQLSGGGSTIETAAIDYILPYWMARHHGLPV